MARIGLAVMMRINGGVLAVFVGVAALIGVDAFALVVTAAAVWPVGVAIALGLLGAAYYLHRAYRRRR